MALAPMRIPDSPALPADTDRIGQLAGWLLGQGILDEQGLDRARHIAAESDQRLDTVLTQLGLVSERSLAEAWARLLDMPLADPARFPSTPLWPDRLKPKFLRKARVIPVASDGVADAMRLVIAVADPLDDFVPAAIGAATGCSVAIEIAIPIELEAALDRLYPDQAEAADTSRDDAARWEPLEEDAERLKDLASEAPVIRVVNQIIGTAVETLASDIHIEPFEDRLRVRYRYDGVLHEIEAPPVRLTAAIVSRIKIMARLDIAERRLPQDGRIKLAVRGQDIDFRVSTIPSLHGETVVLRVLDRHSVVFDYARLGLSPPIAAGFRQLLDLPNGMVLVTGPTGSGKTTTLYTGLRHLDAVARKIVTVEDPIEFQFAGINQIQVKPAIGLNFASLLRSILRQDPDIIMVGEIRDLETAQIAVQASLTGHLVLSTLHTNSAAATVTRLRDMGLEDYLITAVLKGVLAQRLVRRLCPDCRQVGDAPPELIRRFDLGRRTALRPIPYYHPGGCGACRGTGYRGRQAIGELLLPNGEIERLIFGRADHLTIERAAVEAGMCTMFDAGLDAALNGVTTIEEVVRSIRAEG